MSTNNKVRIKLEQLARWRVSGKADTVIATELGMSYSGLQRLIRLPEYLLIEDEVRRDNLKDADAKLKSRNDALKIQLEDAVPEALNNLIDQVRQKRDLRASLELLDRDPQRRFTKASRVEQTNAPPPQLPDRVVETASSEANSTIDLIQRAGYAAPDKPAEA